MNTLLRVRNGTLSYFLDLPTLILERNLGNAVLSTKYLVPGTKYLVLGTKYSVLGTWYQVPNTWYQVPSTWYQVPSTWYQVANTWYQVPSTWYQVLSTWSIMWLHDYMLNTIMLLHTFVGLEYDYAIAHDYVIETRACGCTIM